MEDGTKSDKYLQSMSRRWNDADTSFGQHGTMPKSRMTYKQYMM